MSDERTIIARRSPSQLSLEPGTRLNGIFEIERQIGAGGMGRVYKARNIDTCDAVAVKVVRSEMVSNPQVMALFRKEAAVLNTLLHDAIVRYYLLTTDPDLELPYIVTEFVDGIPLSDVIDEGPLKREDVIALGVRLAEGLESAHKLQTFHRDISPDNIILPDGDVRKAKIIDFGIARASLLGKGTVIGDSIAGKFDYMSPEQVGLNGAVDARSDIYSLGIVLTETALGKSLGMGGTQFEVVTKRKVDPDLSAIEAKLRTVLAAMLRPRPEDRLPSMTAVAERFRVLGGPAAAVKRNGRRGSIGIAAALLIAAALGGGAYVAFAPADDPVVATGPSTGGEGGEPRLIRQANPSLSPPTASEDDPATGNLPSEQSARNAASTTNAVRLEGQGAPAVGTRSGAPSGDAAGADERTPPDAQGTATAIDDETPPTGTDGPNTPPAATPEARGGVQPPLEAAPRPGGERTNPGPTEEVASTVTAFAGENTGPSGPDAAEAEQGGTGSEPDSTAAAAGTGAVVTASRQPEDAPSDPIGADVALGESQDAPDASSRADGLAVTTGAEPEPATISGGTPSAGEDAAAITSSGDPDPAPATVVTPTSTGLDGSRPDAVAANDGGPGADRSGPAAPDLSPSGGEPERLVATDSGPRAREPSGTPPVEVAVDSGPPGAEPEGNRLDEATADRPPASDRRGAGGEDGLAGGDQRQDDVAMAIGREPSTRIDEAPIERATPPQDGDPVEPATPPGDADPVGGGDVDLESIDPRGGPVGQPEFAILRYVRRYDPGPCTLLRLTTFGPRRAEIIGYGTDDAPFLQFDSDFRESFGFEARIKVGVVSPAQCPMLDFLRRVGPGDEGTLRMQVDNEMVSVGGVLSGVITGLHARDAAILLVDDDGLVYGVNDLVSRGKDDATVHIRIAMRDTNGRAVRPQLLVAIAGTDVPRLSTRPTDAKAAVDALNEALRRSGTLETSIAYYQFGR